MKRRRACRPILEQWAKAARVMGNTDGVEAKGILQMIVVHQWRTVLKEAKAITARATTARMIPEKATKGMVKVSGSMVTRVRGHHNHTKLKVKSQKRRKVAANDTKVHALNVARWGTRLWSAGACRRWKAKNLRSIWVRFGMLPM